MKLFTYVISCLFALNLMQGCGGDKASEPATEQQQIPAPPKTALRLKSDEGYRDALVVDHKYIKVVGGDGKIIDETKVDNTIRLLSARLLFPYLDKYRDQIKNIDLSHLLDASDEPAIKEFFAKVRKLARLESFIANLSGALSDSPIWLGIASLPNLKEVSIPWEDEAVAALVANSPDIQQISFPDNSNGDLSASSLDSLSSLNNLQEIAVSCLRTKNVIGILQRGSKGFAQLKKMNFYWDNGKVSDELAKNFAGFKNLTSLAFFGAKEQALLNFLQKAASMSPKKLQELEIDPYSYFKPDTASYKELINLLPSLDLKRLKLTSFDLDDGEFKILERLENIEELDVEIHKSKNINTIKSLIRNLKHLKVLTLRKIAGGTINRKEIPDEFIGRQEFAELEKEFPTVKITNLYY